MESLASSPEVSSSPKASDLCDTAKQIILKKALPILLWLANLNVYTQIEFLNYTQATEYLGAAVKILFELCKKLCKKFL